MTPEQEHTELWLNRAIGLAVGALLFAAVAFALGTEAQLQEDRDARRIDVIERRLGIPGPDGWTVDELLATVTALEARAGE